MLIVLSCKQSVMEEKIPITTNSEKAKELYDKAFKTWENVYLYKVPGLMEQALEADPDFFIVNYSMACFYLLFDNEKMMYREYAENAMKCEANLSEGELILKDVVAKWLENPDADVTEFGDLLVQKYPNDKMAYYFLELQYKLNKDHGGVLSTAKKLLEITDRPDMAYNIIAYAYLNLDSLEEAEKAFDKYIELNPELPNAYDSKGDYYLKIKDYEKAYKSFMKAHEIDSLWGYQRAMEVKAIMDSLVVE